MTRQIFLFQELGTNMCLFWHDAEGCFDAEKPHRSGFCLKLRPVFQWPQVQPLKQKQYNLRWSIRNGARREPFLGGSAPALSGLAAAQRLRRRGSLPPNVSTGIPRSVAGRVVGDAASRIAGA